MARVQCKSDGPPNSKSYSAGADEALAAGGQFEVSREWTMTEERKVTVVGGLVLHEIETTERLYPEVQQLIDLERKFFEQVARVHAAGAIPVELYRTALSRTVVASLPDPPAEG